MLVAPVLIAATLIAAVLIAPLLLAPALGPRAGLSARELSLRAQVMRLKPPSLVEPPRGVRGRRAALSGARGRPRARARTPP